MALGDPYRLDPLDPEGFVAKIAPMIRDEVERHARQIVLAEVPKMVGRMLNDVVSSRAEDITLREQFDAAIKAEVERRTAAYR